MIRTTLGYVGLLALVVVAIETQGCANPPTVGEIKSVATRAERVVEDARNASEKTCEPSIRACAVYYDAVEAGLVRPDDRAEIACAGASTVCELVNK